MDHVANRVENDSGAVPDARLDTVGLYCPLPIIKTAAMMKTLKPGAVLEVLSDDRVILIDMPAWCRSTRNDYLGSSRTGSEYRLLVRKGRPGSIAAASRRSEGKGA